MDRKDRVLQAAGAGEVSTRSQNLGQMMRRRTGRERQAWAGLGGLLRPDETHTGRDHMFSEVDGALRRPRSASTIDNGSS